MSWCLSRYLTLESLSPSSFSRCMKVHSYVYCSFHFLSRDPSVVLSPQLLRKPLQLPLVSVQERMPWSISSVRSWVMLRIKNIPYALTVSKVTHAWVHQQCFHSSSMFCLFAALILFPLPDFSLTISNLLDSLLLTLLQVSPAPPKSRVSLLYIAPFASVQISLIIHKYKD